MGTVLQIVWVNGERREVSAKTISDLVAEIGMAPATLLIEHNGQALTRGEWAAREVNAGDKLEVLRISAGG